MARREKVVSLAEETQWLDDLRERREKALDEAIGGLKLHVSVLHLKPGDLVVCSFPELLSHTQMNAVSERVCQVLTGRGIDRRDILVVSGGTELRNYVRADALDERLKETAPGGAEVVTTSEGSERP